MTEYLIYGAWALSAVILMCADGKLILELFLDKKADIAVCFLVSSPLLIFSFCVFRLLIYLEEREFARDEARLKLV
jgi:hypothetical protein